MGRKRDVPEQLAFDAGAPQPERTHALSELHKAYAPNSLSGLLPSDNVRQVIEYIQNDLAEQQLAKASPRAQIIPFPRGMNRDGKEGMQSVRLDEFQLNVMGDWYEKPGNVTFESQRMMVEQTPILSAVVYTRIRQMMRFCAPQENQEGPGFVIRHVDPDHKESKEDKDAKRHLSRFFTNCGWEFNPRKRLILKRDSFTPFMAKIIRDSLTMDSAAIETEYKMDRDRGMAGFYAVDGSTIRLCTEDGYQGDDQIYALQVVQGRVRAKYSYYDLIYQPRNPVTDVRLAGYGVSETELLIRVVTGFLNAMTLNIKGFSDSSIPRGILHLVGDFTPADLNAFKRYWGAMTKGVNNAWTLPVMVSADKDGKAQFERIDAGFNEMYFSKWMTFLTSIICALHCMSPEEINFESFSAGRSSMSGSDTAEKIALSTDKGLRPLLSHFESLMSDFICSDFSDQFVFRFAGLEEEDADKKHELRKLTQSIDEIRAEDGREPYPDPIIGGAPANPALMALYQQNQQNELDAGQQGDFGQPPPGEGDEDGQAGGKTPGDGEQAGVDDKGNEKILKAVPPPYRLGWWP